MEFSDVLPAKQHRCWLDNASAAFCQNGNLTLGTGKVFHEGAPPQQDYPFSWSFEEMPYGWGGPDLLTGGPPGSNCTDGLIVRDYHSLCCPNGVIGCPSEYRVAEDNLSMWCMVNETALGDTKLLDEAEAQNAIDRLRYAAKFRSREAGKGQPPPFPRCRVPPPTFGKCHDLNVC